MIDIRDYNTFSQDELNGLFYIENGELKHKSRPKQSKVVVGEKAGQTFESGYQKISIDRSYWFAHRLVWIMTHGSIPEDKLIDHRDGNKQNNDPSNLRLCTPSENIQYWHDSRK